MAKELNLYVKPGADIYTANADGDKIEVVIMRELERGRVLVEALRGEPFDGSTVFGGAFMTCQAVYRKDALQFSRKAE